MAKSRLLKRLALSAAALALILCAGEWLARIAFRRNVEALKFSGSDLYYYYDRAGYRRNIPNKIGYERMWNGQGKAEFRMNSLGFRGPEISPVKPAGAFRVLFLGDSITIGGRLPEDVTYVNRVRRALAAEGRFEVINAGAGDVGLYEEERTLRHEGIGVRPDLVVLCWYLNDARPPIGFPEETIYRNSFIRWFNTHPSVQKSYLAGFLYDTIRKSLVERRLARDHRFDWIPRYRSGRWVHDLTTFLVMVQEARYDWGDAWNDGSIAWMGRKIVLLRDFAAARGARFAVVMMPLGAQVFNDTGSPLVDKPQQDLSAYLDRNGVPFLDLLPLLRRQAKTAKGPIFYDQCHYTPYGNGVVARDILGFLRRSRLLGAAEKR